MKLIPLTRGLFAKVDDEDYDYLMQWKWCAGAVGCNRFYARRSLVLNGKSMHIQMSRLIMQTPLHLTCDHINHDTLDNQRHNLRNCSQEDNNRNSVSKGGVAKYVGVAMNPPSRLFRARICFKRKTIHLGYFNNAWAAAIAYDKAAKLYFGEFANLNFK